MSCTLPVATYLSIRYGSTVVANASQAGHWKSDQTSTLTGAFAWPSARGLAGSMSATGAGRSGLTRVPTVAFGLRTPDARTTTTSPTTTAAAVIRAIGDCQAGRLTATVRAEARRWSRRAASRRSCRVAGGRRWAGVFGGGVPAELEFVDMRTLDGGGGVDVAGRRRSVPRPARDCPPRRAPARRGRSGPVPGARLVAGGAAGGRATGPPPGT